MTKGQIKLQCKDRDLLVDGWIFKSIGLGFYKTDSNEYKVTHLSSGLAAFAFSRRRDALSFISRVKTLTDWTVGETDIKDKISRDSGFRDAVYNIGKEIRCAC